LKPEKNLSIPTARISI